MQYGVVQSAARVCSSLRKTHEHGSLPPTPEQHVGCRAYRDRFTCRTGLHLQTKSHVRKLCIFLVIHQRDRIHCLHITLNMNKQITLLISRKKNYSLNGSQSALFPPSRASSCTVIPAVHTLTCVTSPTVDTFSPSQWR